MKRYLCKRLSTQFCANYSGCCRYPVFRPGFGLICKPMCESRRITSIPDRKVSHEYALSFSPAGATLVLHERYFSQRLGSGAQLPEGCRVHGALRQIALFPGAGPRNRHRTRHERTCRGGRTTLSSRTAAKRSPAVSRAPQTCVKWRRISRRNRL